VLITPGQAGKKLPDVPRPIPPPKYLPDPGDTSFHFDQTRPLQEPDINRVFRSGDEESYAHLSGPNDDFAVPKISELGLKPPTTTHRGGETVALAQLDKIIADETYTATFSKPDTAPTAFSPQSTTLLSPHLHFGSLSCREFYHRARAVIDTYKKSKAATIPTNLIGQLLFRDMYFGAQAALGHSFAQMVGNPYCRFIPWHLPSKISPSTGLTTGEYTIDSPLAEAWFQRWKFGRTGFPWIDALMRQLRQEGWIHHLGRHAVACFLTRGGCYIDWERGADVFAEWLIDHEAACNAGNWQWLACAAFYSQFFRCYSPIAFPKKWDPEGKFVKRYVPELAGYSQKYIYEPWKAPVADQKNWGCLIQGDGNEVAVAAASMKTYPKPMFDFTERREICIQSIKRAYKINLYGADPMVQNGTWKQLFGVEDSNQGGETIEETDEHKAREAPTAAFAAGGEGEEGVDEDEREAAHHGIGDQGGEESIKGREREKRDGRQMTLDRLFTKGRSAGEDREGNKRRRKM
jgi:deoxyribodipyrimidine photolyase